MGLFPGSQAPPMPSYLAPAFHTVQRVLHTLHKILAVPGNLAWERREGSPNVCSFTPSGTPGLIAQQHSTPEMRNSVKPGARGRIYSQLRRGCRASIKSSWSNLGRARRSSLPPIPKTASTRHHFQNIESESTSSLCLSCRMFTPWLWACVTSPYMWLCGFPLSSQSAKRVAALGCSSYGSGKHYSLHTQNHTQAPNTHVRSVFSEHLPCTLQ